MVTVIAAKSGSSPVCFKTDSGNMYAEVKRLEAQGYSILETKSHNKLEAIATQLSKDSVSKTRFDTRLFANQLRSLLAAGISVPEAIQTLALDDAVNSDLLTLQKLRADIDVGLTLSGAMKLQPNAFDPMLIATVSSAERSGSLQQALQRYIRFMSSRAAVRDRLLSMLVYPSVLVGVGILVIGFLLMFVVPRFASTIHQGRASISQSSQLLVSVSEFAASYGFGIAIALGFLVGLIAMSSRFRASLLRAVLSITIFSSLTILQKRFWQSQFFDATSLLLSAGFTVSQALQAAAALLPVVAKDNAAAAVAQIESGQLVSEAFSTQGLASGIALAMIRAGEKSGLLAEQLLGASRFLEDGLLLDLKRWLKAAEPLLLLVIGSITGLVLALLYIPIFELAGSL